MLDRTKAIYATCTRKIRTLTGRYREFLLDPGTPFTLASGLLLIAVAIHRPAGIISSGDPADASTPLYLASALVGSAYIGWAALQGIRRRNSCLTRSPFGVRAAIS